eukprot:m.429957 g.429957  ORF g.429957 m.429957 type:complete len:175 (+) comp21390_c0_seq1:51-575(+)
MGFCPTQPSATQTSVQLTNTVRSTRRGFVLHALLSQYMNVWRVTHADSFTHTDTGTHRTHTRGDVDTQASLPPRRGLSHHSSISSIDSDTCDTAAARRISLSLVGEQSSKASAFSAGGFTLSHCDDPDLGKDPQTAAQEAYESAVELHLQCLSFATQRASKWQKATAAKPSVST